MNIRFREAVEIPVGATVLGIGVTLMLSLPPNWWPDMTSYLIRFGIILGFMLFVVGTSLFVMGISRLVEYDKATTITRLREQVLVTAKSRYLWLVSLAILFGGPLIWRSKEKIADQAPSNNGACSNSINGNNNYQNNNCYEFGPPQLPDHAYQNGVLIAIFPKISRILPNNTVNIVNPHYSLKDFVPSDPLEINHLKINCPFMINDYKTGGPGVFTSMIGTMTCDVVGIDKLGSP